MIASLVHFLPPRGRERNKGKDWEGEDSVEHDHEGDMIVGYP